MGTGLLRSDGDEGPATLASVAAPHCFSSDEGQYIYLCDSAYRIRRVDRATGQISTVAGRGQRGLSGDGGPAIAAEIGMPISLVVDQEGDLYIADDTSNRIRRVDSKSGVIETFAGTGKPSTGSLVAPEFSGDGGPALEARIILPHGLTLDKLGNLLFVVSGRICRIDHASQILSTVAGNGHVGSSGDGGPAQDAWIEPTDIALDAAGNIFFSEYEGNRVRRIDAKTGIISTIAGNGLPKRTPRLIY